MYLTAASAAWRYSGKVTGPDSMLSRPSVIGVPVAFLGVPSADDVSGVDAAADGVDFAAAVVDDDDFESLPQPATRTPAAAIAARPPVQFLVTFMVLLWVGFQAEAGTAASPR